jgi:hypothetical protein
MAADPYNYLNENNSILLNVKNPKFYNEIYDQTLQRMGDQTFNAGDTAELKDDVLMQAQSILERQSTESSRDTEMEEAKSEPLFRV